MDYINVFVKPFLHIDVIKSPESFDHTYIPQFGHYYGYLHSPRLYLIQVDLLHKTNITTEFPVY